MGFGIALASGFIKEANAIGREKAKAKSDLAQLAQDNAVFEQQELFKARIQSGVARKKRGQEVEDAKRLAVSTALQQGLEDGTLTDAGMQAIGTGGIAIKPEYFDFSKTKAALDSVNNQMKYGIATFQKPDKWDEDLRADNPKRAGGAWLGYFNNVFGDERRSSAFLEALRTDDNARNLFMNDLQKYSDYYIDGQLIREGIDPDATTSYKAPQADFKQLFDAAESIGIKTDTDANPKIIKKALENGTIENPNNSVVVTFTSPENVQKKDAIDFSDTDFTSLRKLSQNAGYGDNVQEFVDNFTDFARADTAEDAYEVLLTAAYFQGQGYGALNKTAGGSAEMRANLGNDLQERFGDDPYLMAQSLAPLMTLPEDAGAASRKRKGYVVKMKPPEDYFARNKLSKEKIMEQYEASNTAIAQLEQLNALLSDEETPVGLKAKLQQVGFGVFGEGGQVEQLFGNFALDTEEGTTPESLKQTAIDAGFLSVDTATKLSTIDALKLSLAAQMARAVDPSGRLSNQDFEIQLQRLGQTGLFTAKPQAKASLAQVISDFKRTQRRLVLLNEVASAEEFGLREARILKADRIARNSLNAAYVAKSSARGTQAGVSEDVVTPTGTLRKDPDLDLYFDENNNAFKDAEGTQPMKPEDVLKMMGAA